MEPADKKRRATYQDVIDSPANSVAEIISGTLRVSNRPANPATTAASTLGFQLGPPFHFGSGGPGGWLILVEPEIHFGDDVLVPDLAGWRRDRMPVVEDAAYITLRPDWICEVLSKSTEKTDRAEKMPIYAAAAVEFAWLIHPRRRTLEAFRAHDGKWLAIGVYTDDDRARIEPFDAIELDLGRLWADAPLPPRAAESPTHCDYEAY